MPEFTLPEAREQAIKAGRYFARVLEEQGATYLATEVAGVTLVVARDSAAEKLDQAIADGLFGAAGAIQRPTEAQEAAVPESAGDLKPLYHQPPAEFANRTGHIHLHVTRDLEIGRRKRSKGECLCSKRRGSDERPVPPEAHTFCPECVEVATRAGLSW